MMTAIKDCNNIEVLQHVDKNVTASQNLLKIIPSVPELAIVESPTGSKRKCYQNIEKQPRFYSTKKKKTVRTSIRYGKPNLKEKQ